MKVLQDGYRFYIDLGDAIAQIVCEKKGTDLLVLSSFTPEEHRGKGIGSMIMNEVIKYAKVNKLRIVPKCSFAVHYCSKNKC
jgi:predicted GNAT family acetyltransferase